MSGTSPDSVAYPEQNYGILGPLPAYVINIQDVPGADPTGNDDSTGALNFALSSLPDSGGVLEIAPGTYKFSGPLRAKSNTVIGGSGTLKAAPLAEWVPNNEYWCITNINNDAAVITDENLTVRDITIDYSDFPSAPFGTRWCIYWRKARNVRNLNVRTIGGTNHVAHRGCEQVLTAGSHAVGFSNCGFDHWEECNDVEVNGGYFESASTNQMGNFNPELNNTSTGYTCSKFRMIGVQMNYTGASQTAVQIEPLYNVGSSVTDVVVSGCLFTNTRLIMRGATSSVSVTGNTFRTGGSGEVLASYPFLGGSPSAFVISGNTFIDPATTGPNGGVIRVEMDMATVIGNVITGTAYAGQAIYRDTFKPNILANRVETTPQPGTLQAGFRVINGSDNYFGIEDASGTTGWRHYVQTDNTAVWATTTAAGAGRTIATIAARSDTSQLSFFIPLVLADVLRLSPATALTAAGSTTGTALVLAKNFNEVTTTAVGTGVRLPSPGAQSVTGTRVVVWNAGANTLNVYPMSSGQINALGVDVADTIASGACKTYVALSSTLYRVET